MSIFTKIFSGEGTNIINSVGNVLDNLITTKAEKQELQNEEFKAERDYILEQKRLGIKETELYLSDAQSARSHETSRDNNQNSSWLSKNIHEIIALLFTIPFVVSWFFINIELPAIASQAIMLILGYLYGRSKPQS